MLNDEWHSHYREALLLAEEKLNGLVQGAGLSSINLEVGNKHGEAYSDAGTGLKEKTSLHQIRIWPSATGSALIKFTFENPAKGRLFTALSKESFPGTAMSPDKSNGRVGLNYVLIPGPPKTSVEESGALIVEQLKLRLEMLSGLDQA